MYICIYWYVQYKLGVKMNFLECSLCDDVQQRGKIFFIPLLV